MNSLSPPPNILIFNVSKEEEETKLARFLASISGHLEELSISATSLRVNLTHPAYVFLTLAFEALNFTIREQQNRKATSQALDYIQVNVLMVP